MTGKPTSLADLLAKANDGENPRTPGEWTPAACAVWNNAESEVRDLFYAALVWELKAEHRARPEDEPAIRKRVEAIKVATAAVVAKDTTAA